MQTLEPIINQTKVERTLADKPAAAAANPFDEALQLQKAGRHKEAIARYDEAIRLNPRVAEAYNNRGGAYNMLGQQQRALQDYNEAIRIDPRYARAYAGRGIALLDLGRDAESESDFKKAFDLDPSLKNDFEPLINKAKTKRARAR